MNKSFLIALFLSSSALLAGAPGAPSPSDWQKAFLAPPVPHIAISGCNRGYLNADGELADALDPNPTKRAISIRYGWETHVKIGNNSKSPLWVKVLLHPADGMPFTMAYRDLHDRSLIAVEAGVGPLYLRLEPQEIENYIFNPYYSGKPGGINWTIGEWIENAFGNCFTPQPRNAWATIQVLTETADGHFQASQMDAVEISITYQYRENGIVVNHATVGITPPAMSFSSPFERMTSPGGPWAEVGLAITNPNAKDVSVKITLREKDGERFSTTDLFVQSGRQLLGMLGDLLPMDADFEGTLTIASRSGDPVSILGLQMRGKKDVMSEMTITPMNMGATTKK